MPLWSAPDKIFALGYPERDDSSSLHNLAHKKGGASGATSETDGTIRIPWERLARQCLDVTRVEGS